MKFSHPYVAEPDKPKNLQEVVNNTRELRALTQSDPHRPIYHFLAPEGHVAPFDPNGAIYWKGKYHLGFVYQTRSRGDFFSNKGDYAWGHAVSTDLLHWTLYPNMLEVTDGELGIYSGGAFLSREGVPHLIYHTRINNAKVNNIAYATDDDLKVWKKFENNPVLQDETPKDWKGKNPFLNPARYTVFDPDAWYDKIVDAYYQISSGAKPGLFKSRDMRTWSYLGDLIDEKNRMHNSNEDLSCPVFFPVGNGKSILLFISHNWGAQYYIGTFGNDRFTVEQHARMNWPGGSFFAAERLQDDKGRNIVWGWILEHKPQHLPDYGWSGIMSLPRVVSLGGDGRVRINPADELKAARVIQTKEDDIHLEPGSERTLRSRGRSIELKLEIFGAENDPVGIKVFASPDGREETIITYDPRSGELAIDFSKSSVRGPVTIPAIAVVSFDGSDIAGFPKNVSEQRAPLKLNNGEPLKLNVFLDRSVIEVFANGVQCVTQVVYPELETSTGVKIFSGNEKVSVKNIQSWTMAETNAY
jgi:beta-fructofuranosidase